MRWEFALFNNRALLSQFSLNRDIGTMARPMEFHSSTIFPVGQTLLYSKMRTDPSFIQFLAVESAEYIITCALV